jgi:Oxidoreductase molybdopterin binding domain
MAHRQVTVSAHSVSGTFSGVPLTDLLRLVGVAQGDSLRGPALASYVLVEGADGYRAVFGLAEMNDSFSERVPLLADQKDGGALSAKDGPYQLILPGEKRPARWVRQVQRISVVQLPSR